MDPAELYRQKLVSIPEAVGLVQSRQTIGVALAASEPPGLLGELSNHKDRLENVTVWVALPLRPYDFVYQPEMAGHFFVENWFYGAPDRQVHAQVEPRAVIHPVEPQLPEPGVPGELSALPAVAQAEVELLRPGSRRHPR